MKAIAKIGLGLLLLTVVVLTLVPQTLAVSSSGGRTSIITVNDSDVNKTVVVGGLPQGATVQFVLNGGVPILSKAGSDGTAKYLLLSAGNISITATLGGNAIGNYTVTFQTIVIPTPPSSGGNGTSIITVNDSDVNKTVVVSGLPQGATVQFVLNGGVPVLSKAGSDGIAKYLLLAAGNISITATLGGNAIGNYTVVFQTIVIPTPPPSSRGSSSGGGGSGSGGSGVVSAEPYDNIAISETVNGNLIANTPVTYSFTTPGLSVYQVSVVGKDSESDISIRVESLKGTSKLARTSAPGQVYMNVNIWPGTQAINNATVKFKVNNSWIESNSIDVATVQLLNWDGNKWASLDTKVTGKDSIYTYFESGTTGLSIFAISSVSGTQGTAVPSATVTGETPTSVTTPATKGASSPATVPTKSPGFETVMVIGTISAIYLYRRMGR